MIRAEIQIPKVWFYFAPKTKGESDVCWALWVHFGCICFIFTRNRFFICFSLFHWPIFPPARNVKVSFPLIWYHFSSLTSYWSIVCPRLSAQTVKTQTGCGLYLLSLNVLKAPNTFNIYLNTVFLNPFWQRAHWILFVVSCVFDFVSPPGHS